MESQLKKINRLNLNILIFGDIYVESTIQGLSSTLPICIIFRACYFLRLAKSVASFLSVKKTCLLVSVPSVNILPVWTRNRVIVKNVEYAGKSTVQGAFP